MKVSYLKKTSLLVINCNQSRNIDAPFWMFFFLILRDWWPHKNDWSWLRSDAVNNKILKIKPRSILKRVGIRKMSFAVLVTHILEFLFSFYNWSLKVNVKVFLHCGNEYSDKWTKRFFKSNKLGFIVLGRDTNGICSLIDVLFESLFTALWLYSELATKTTDSQTPFEFHILWIT